MGQTHYSANIRIGIASPLLAALCLTMAPVPAAQALTPQELFEKIIPKVKQPARHRAAAKPRVARPLPVDAKPEPSSKPEPSAKIDTSSAALPLPKAKPDIGVAEAPAAAPTVEASAVPLPRPNPKLPEATAPPPEPARIADAPVTTKVQTVAIAPDAVLAAPSIGLTDAKSKKTDRLKPTSGDPRLQADRIERAKQATAMMAGAATPPIDFQELAFAPPVLATPLSPAPATPALSSVPVRPVAPTLASAASGFSTALVPPTPRRRPDVVPAALSTPIRPALPEGLAACRAGLSGLKISATSLPPLQVGSCGAPDPYDVQSLDGGNVTLMPAAKTNCEMATQLAHWLDDKVQPAAIAKLGGRVTGLRIADSYSCRNRDNLADAQLSEHAFMNAVDVAAFQVNGKWIPVEQTPGRTGSEQAFLDQARAGACDEFMTVLGPGSDSYHASHFHLDMRHRGRHGDSRYCH